MVGRSRLVILMYHRVLPEADPLRPADITLPVFTQCMRYLKRFFNVLPLQAAAIRLAEGSLPPRAVAVTFDDGYADNAVHAAPVLSSLGLPATVFVATGFLDGGRMWNDTVIEAVRGAGDGQLDAGAAGRLQLRTDRDRARAVGVILNTIKHLPADERAREVAGIAARSGAPQPQDLMMTSAQVAALEGDGITVGAHTISHPILANESGEDAAAEIVGSRRALERICGRGIDLFAYPNGRPGTDYRPADVEAVRQAGFSHAVSTSWGSAGAESDPLQLPRIGPWDQSGWRLSLRILKTYFDRPQDTQ